MAQTTINGKDVALTDALSILGISVSNDALCVKHIKVTVLPDDQNSLQHRRGAVGTRRFSTDLSIKNMGRLYNRI